MLHTRTPQYSAALYRTLHCSTVLAPDVTLLYHSTPVAPLVQVYFRMFPTSIPLRTTRSSCWLVLDALRRVLRHSPVLSVVAATLSVVIALVAIVSNSDAVDAAHRAEF